MCGMRQRHSELQEQTSGGYRRRKLGGGDSAMEEARYVQGVEDHAAEKGVLVPATNFLDGQFELDEDGYVVPSLFIRPVWLHIWVITSSRRILTRISQTPGRRMNRPRKKKESSLLHELKELELLEEGELVDIPELENDDLLEENSMSVIVRCLNPTVHKVGGLVKALPPIWGLEDCVRGRGVGEDRVQFIFQNNRDLHHVLTKGPWFVNGWIVSLDQWIPNPGPEFLCRIPFWIRIKGIPIHLLKKQAVESLMGPLGKVEKVELHAKHSSSVEYIRALVWINTEEPIQFRRTARFKSGEIVPTELEYEKLLKVCFTCKRLTHDQLYCPLQVGQAENPQLSSDRGRRDSRVLGPRGVDQLGERAAKRRAQEGHCSIGDRKLGDRKGKSVAGGNSQVWKPKKTQPLTQRGHRRSKSTEESSAIPKSDSLSQGKIISASSSGASQGSPSVFNRLSGLKDNTPNLIIPSREISEADKISPSVFERLGEQGIGSPSGSETKRGE
ncbi:hypothetical protein HID58_014370 [Brassica napus]|uniref:DUF4283 domain-containing protein n=1 Tax=Brassica napus TaxID=3708 RepID=A0ABQ8DIS9_BRANA|nr:hypothetical protein HID58_014370 [Brassica napus]